MTQQGCYGGGRRQEEPCAHHPYKRRKRNGGGRVCGWMCGHELDPNQLSRDLLLCLFLYLSVTPSSPSFFVSFYFSFSIAVAPAHSCGLHSLWLIHKHWLNLLTSSHFPLPTLPLWKATAKTTSHLAPCAAISIHHSECKRGLGITWQEALVSSD